MYSTVFGRDVDETLGGMFAYECRSGDRDLFPPPALKFSHPLGAPPQFSVLLPVSKPRAL